MLNGSEAELSRFTSINRNEVELICTVRDTARTIASSCLWLWLWLWFAVSLHWYHVHRTLPCALLSNQLCSRTRCNTPPSCTAHTSAAACRSSAPKSNAHTMPVDPPDSLQGQWQHACGGRCDASVRADIVGEDPKGKCTRRCERACGIADKANTNSQNSSITSIATPEAT